jgi:hypothetical protein
MRYREFAAEDDVDLGPLDPYKMDLDRESKAMIAKFGMPKVTSAWVGFVASNLPSKNILGVNVAKTKESLVGRRAFHCTNKLAQIQKAGALKPKADITGGEEYGRNVPYFRPAKGVFVSLDKPEWFGKHCLSFEIQPEDTVLQTYGGAYIVTNPISFDRLEIQS